MRRPESDTADAAVTVLDRVRSTHQAALVWQADELAAVVAWADLHRLETPLDVPATSRPGSRGTEGALFLAGPGASGVEEFSLCDLAATLGISERGARKYLGEALELRDRLPRLYASTLEGMLPTWRAREIAAQTRTLSAEVAAFVDAHLAQFAHKINVGRIRRCVEAALLHCDPETARMRAEAAAEQRHVKVEDHLDGVSTLTAVLHTPDAVALEQQVFIVAEWLAVLGDADPLAVRQARALALLADPQAALELEQHAWAHVRSNSTDQPPDRTPSDGTPADPGAGTATGSGRPTFHLHVHLSEAALSPVVRVEGARRRLPIPLAAVEQWLADVAPDTVLKVTPVVDTTERIAVDGYEVPPRLAHQVHASQHVCAFPWCGRRGRYDLDHINPYIPPDEGGPPGQTSSSNLARLCRFHHRVKTHTDWTYRRDPDRSLHWTSPTGAQFRVDATGTERIR